MSSTPIFDHIRAEHLKVANAAYSQGRIAERNAILAILKKQSRPTQQLLTLIKVLELRDTK
jgi:hypothetical protein